MDHSWYLASVFSLDRKAVTSVTHSDHGILQVSADCSVDHGIQGVMHFVIHLTHGTADRKECRAGIIGHLVIRKDTAADL